MYISRCRRYRPCWTSCRIYTRTTRSLFVPPSHCDMSICNLRFTRNSALRTVLIDESTGNPLYQIDTPIRLVGSVTRIRRLDSSKPHPHLHRDDDSDSDDSSYDGKKRRSSDDGEDGKLEEESEQVLPETSDEVARIYWKWFSADVIILHGKRSLRTEFLPKCGKMKG